MSAHHVEASTTDDDLHDLVAFSRELTTKHQASTGAYPAAPSYAVYQYCWLRDGSFIAEGLSRHGEVESAQGFHLWCARTITARREVIEDIVERLARGDQVPHEELLPTRYTVEGTDGTDEWWDFQTDGYGTWMWALATHLRRHGGDPQPYRAAVALTARYLSEVWQQPCYDWWEEHPGDRHVSTLGSIDAGLRAALEFGLLDEDDADRVVRARRELHQLMAAHGRPAGHLVKSLGGSEVDGSLLALIAPFEVVDGAIAQATLAAVERDLVRRHGVYRYQGDTFYGGGRWPVLAAFHGLALVTEGRHREACEALKWIASTASPAGYLPEQVGDPLLHPQRHLEWVRRWGPVASPLLWSHGMYLVLADELELRS
jgi:GH15 family glucan-1,4-alpha-glucosidase